MVVDDNQFDPKKLGLPSDVDIYSMRDELDLINTFIDVVRDWDPDIVAGFEIQNDSWGYLLERGKAYGMTQVNKSRYGNFKVETK